MTTTFTENGALSLATTGSAVLDFFFKMVRNTPSDTAAQLMNAAWKENPLLTLRAVFHLRDCRGGKGEKKKFHECLEWLATVAPQHITANLEHVAFYGSYKDLLMLACPKTPLGEQALVLFAKTLCSDIDTLNFCQTARGCQQDDSDTQSTMSIESISLAAKWAPTEGGEFDKKHALTRRLVRLLSTSCKPTTVNIFNHRDYRKLMISPLRADRNIVETHMCSGDWDGIRYSGVPSVAMKNYRKAFARHSEARFQEYMTNVSNGTEKINAQMVFPHQLVAHYLRPLQNSVIDDPVVVDVIEAQWKAIVAATRKKFSAAGASCLTMVDTSGV